MLKNSIPGVSFSINGRVLKKRLHFTNFEKLTQVSRAFIISSSFFKKRDKSQNKLGQTLFLKNNPIQFYFSVFSVNMMLKIYYSSCKLRLHVFDFFSIFRSFKFIHLLFQDGGARSTKGHSCVCVILSESLWHTF